MSSLFMSSFSHVSLDAATLLASELRAVFSWLSSYFKIPFHICFDTEIRQLE
jgi:hypothetical protein